MAEEETQEPLTGEEKEQLYNYLSQAQNAPQQEEKYNVHIFLHRVATADDTTKVGYLKEEEVGVPTHPTRALKGFALIASEIMDNEFVANYFEKRSEIVTATSLSRDGFLVKQATTQTRQIADVTKAKRKPSSSWFKKKDDKEGEQLT